MENKKMISYFSGTHWDREWYQTKQGFRFKLVKVLDELIDFLERNEDFVKFYFDGQTVILEDYLEVCPENESRLKNLISAGRIVIGPWYCMPDEHLVSGESLVRNLLKGRSVCTEFGTPAWKNGYVCDMFGHIAQTPQIFRGFGIENAVLGRGTNERTTRAFFTWEAPDGESVTVFKLQDEGGYGGFAMEVCGQRQKFLERDAEDPEFIRRLKKYVDHALAYSPADATAIFDAMDHEPVHPKTMDYVKKINELYPDCACVQGNFDEIFEIARRSNLDVKRGELIETAPEKVLHLFLITNTLSSRYDVKKGNDTCQDLIEKYLEPLSVFAGENGFPVRKGFLDIAWKNLLQVQAHDSICGCSVDRTHREMFYHYSQVESIAEAMKLEFVTSLTGPFQMIDEAHPFVHVFSPLVHETVTELTLTIPFAPDFPKYFEAFNYQEICSFRMENDAGEELPYRIEKLETNRVVRTCSEAVSPCDLYTIRFCAKLLPMSVNAFRIRPSMRPVRIPGHTVKADGVLENEFLRVSVESDGRISLLDKRTNRRYSDLLGFRDDGEIGDGWFSVRPKCDVVSVRAVLEGVDVLSDNESGGTIRVRENLSVPKRMDLAASGIRRDAAFERIGIRAELTLNRGERFLRVKLKVDNVAEDHRLKAIFPTGTRSGEYTVNQSFAFLRRKVGIDETKLDWKESDPLEKNMAGILCRRGADGRGLAFVSKRGLHEAACPDDETSAMEVTLFRGFSRTYTTNGETEGQLAGTLCFDFLLMPVDETVPDSALQFEQNVFKTTFESFVGGALSLTNRLISVDNRRIQFSALKPAEDGCALILRLFNPSPEPQSASIGIGLSHSEFRSADLAENDLGEISSQNLRFEPFQIRTFRIVR